MMTKSLKWLAQLPLSHKLTVLVSGSIKHGMDAFKHILCGASAVEIGTQLIRKETNYLARIANELKNIMREKSYTSINGFKEKLKSMES